MLKNRLLDLKIFRYLGPKLRKVYEFDLKSFVNMAPLSQTYERSLKGIVVTSHLVFGIVLQPKRLNKKSVISFGKKSLVKCISNCPSIQQMPSFFNLRNLSEKYADEDSLLALSPTKQCLVCRQSWLLEYWLAKNKSSF